MSQTLCKACGELVHNYLCPPMLAEQERKRMQEERAVSVGDTVIDKDYADRVGKVDSLDLQPSTDGKSYAFVWWADLDGNRYMNGRPITRLMKVDPSFVLRRPMPDDQEALVRARLLIRQAFDETTSHGMAMKLDAALCEIEQPPPPEASTVEKTEIQEARNEAAVVRRAYMHESNRARHALLALKEYDPKLADHLRKQAYKGAVPEYLFFRPSPVVTELLNALKSLRRYFGPLQKEEGERGTSAWQVARDAFAVLDRHEATSGAPACEDTSPTDRSDEHKASQCMLVPNHPGAHYDPRTGSFWTDEHHYDGSPGGYVREDYTCLYKQEAPPLSIA